MPQTATVRPPANTAALSIAERLYRSHRTRLLAIARRNCGGAEEAEDALQDAFILFIDHFDPACDSPPLAWLTLTLKRRCWVLYQRRRALRPPGQASAGRAHRHADATPDEPADPRRSPSELVEAQEALRAHRARLGVLKPAERRALGLAALGYSYGEICRLTGWTYTKVKRSIYEGNMALRADR